MAQNVARYSPSEPAPIQGLSLQLPPCKTLLDQASQKAEADAAARKAEAPQTESTVFCHNSDILYELEVDKFRFSPYTNKISAPHSKYFDSCTHPHKQVENNQFSNFFFSFELQIRVRKATVTQVTRQACPSVKLSLVWKALARSSLQTLRSQLQTFQRSLNTSSSPLHGLPRDESVRIFGCQAFDDISS